MYVRLTFVGFQPEKLEAAKKTYFDEIVPVVKKQKGNLDCRLLEPVKSGDDYISMTVWDTKEDADRYHTSGVYKDLVNKARPYFSKEAVLKVYSTSAILEHA